MLFTIRLHWWVKLKLVVLFSGGLFVITAGVLRCVLILTVSLSTYYAYAEWDSIWPSRRVPPAHSELGPGRSVRHSLLLLLATPQWSTRCSAIRLVTLACVSTLGIDLTITQQISSHLGIPRTKAKTGGEEFRHPLWILSEIGLHTINNEQMMK